MAFFEGSKSKNREEFKSTYSTDYQKNTNHRDSPDWIIIQMPLQLPITNKKSNKSGVQELDEKTNSCTKLSELGTGKLGKMIWKESGEKIIKMGTQALSVLSSEKLTNNQEVACFNDDMKEIIFLGDVP